MVNINFPFKLGFLEDLKIALNSAFSSKEYVHSKYMESSPDANFITAIFTTVLKYLAYAAVSFIKVYVF